MQKKLLGFVYKANSNKKKYEKKLTKEKVVCPSSRSHQFEMNHFS